MIRFDSRHQLIDLSSGPRGSVDADQFLASADDAPDFRAIRHGLAHLAVGIKGRGAARLLGLHVLHFSCLLRLRFLLVVVK